MNVSSPTIRYFLLVVVGITGCNSERVTSIPSSLREQEVMRLRVADPNKTPVVSGVVQTVDDAGRYPVPTALVSVDGQAFYTNVLGAYRVVLAPGSHQFVVSQTGLRQARTSIKVARGDSIRVNFYLRPAN